MIYTGVFCVYLAFNPIGGGLAGRAANKLLISGRASAFAKRDASCTDLMRLAGGGCDGCGGSFGFAGGGLFSKNSTFAAREGIPSAARGTQE